MTLPFVSCICPTFGRFPRYGHLVCEAVESFVRQTYPADLRELIIVNDCPVQKLVCFTPGVKVINHGRRFDSLGEKLNYGIDSADGHIIFPWDDDDVSLPNRLALSVEHLGTNDYFNPRSYFFQSGSIFQFEQNTGYAHNAACFRRAAWRHVGGYPAISGPQDAAMDGALRRTCRVADGPLSLEETFYVYRWGQSDIHLSGHGDTEKAYKENGLREVVAGEFVIVPHYCRDTLVSGTLVTQSTLDMIEMCKGG